LKRHELHSGLFQSIDDRLRVIFQRTGARRKRLPKRKNTKTRIATDGVYVLAKGDEPCAKLLFE
jgi:hypothetical protein